MQPTATNPILGETIMSMGDIARKLTVSTETAWRWATKGVPVEGQVVVLEAIRVGGRTLSSEQALARFVAKQDAIRAAVVAGKPVAGAEGGRPAVGSQPTAARRRASASKRSGGSGADAAGRELEAMGA